MYLAGMFGEGADEADVVTAEAAKERRESVSIRQEVGKGSVSYLNDPKKSEMIAEV